MPIVVKVDIGGHVIPPAILPDIHIQANINTRIADLPNIGLHRGKTCGKRTRYVHYEIVSVTAIETEIEPSPIKKPQRESCRKFQLFFPTKIWVTWEINRKPLHTIVSSLA